MLRKLAFPFVLMLTLTILVAACGESAAQPTPAPAAPAAQPTAAPAAPAAPAAQPTAAPAAPAAQPTAAPAAPAAAPTAAPAAKVDFPTKGITIIVPFNPGGSTDVGARIVAALMEKDLGQPVQVVNRPGAGGQIGWTELALARPDGYTIGGINLPHLPAVVVDAERQAAFEADDIVPIVSQALDPTMISVSADSPWMTLDDLVEDAKSRPKEIIAGIVGILQDDEIGYLLAAEAAGFDMRAVRFDGAAPAITAVLGGHIDVLFCTVGDNFVQAQAGNIRVLSVLSEERITKFFPDVPTMEELGYPGVYSASTRGFAAPKGVPEPILQILEDALTKAMKDPEHIEKIEAAGQPVVIMPRSEFTPYYYDSYDVANAWAGRAIVMD